MSKGPKTTKVKQDVPKFVEDQIRLAFRRANEFQPDVYEGDRVAGFTPDQQRYMGDVRAYTSGPSQYASAVDAVNQIGSGHRSVLFASHGFNAIFSLMHRFCNT